MSSKTLKKLLNLSDAELRTQLRESEGNLFKLRLQHKTGQLEKTADLWKTRKEVARIKTLMSQKAAQK